MSCRRRLKGAAAVLVCAAAGWGSGPSFARPGPEATPGQIEALLAAMHPDYALYIGEVRYGASRLRPASLYAGLVRRGGRDPRDPADGPRSGRGVANDLIIYADTFEPWRSGAWRLLIADHEYFHARHLARGFRLPVVGFGDAQADTDYHEALAWEWVVRRAGEGIYGRLSPAESAEASSRYERHRDRFRRFVTGRQPSAWAHYGRFLPDPAGLRMAASAPTAGPPPEAGPETR
ncbi:MAG TPA: hypothetical protein VJV23_15705 [Candidatus Polarisedimenticolia bacterium]|nr:hypothetical protein [Candidatus Polarisedimenticolia bacterium]